jgi:hypothetical protein
VALCGEQHAFHCEIFMPGLTGTMRQLTEKHWKSVIGIVIVLIDAENECDSPNKEEISSSLR